MTTKTIYEKIVNILQKNSSAYNSATTPKITDTEFDTLLRQARSLESELNIKENTSVLNNLFKSPTTLNSKEHLTPMLSLNKALQLDEVYSFMKRFPNSNMYASLKLDGCALSIIYINGKLSKALTRGDGFKGEDALCAALNMINVPVNLTGTYPSYLEVRGEVIILKEDFNRINTNRKESNLPEYATARNLVAGSLRLQDVEEIKSRCLRFYGYSIVDSSEDLPDSLKSRIALLKDCGLTPADKYSLSFLSNDIEEIEHFLLSMEDIKNKDFLEYEIDGVVIALDSQDSYIKAGFNADSPKGAIAFKFKNKEALSVVLSIDPQVGRTGILTPVAKIVPTIIDGVEVSNITLHNYSLIKEKDIRVGDVVYIRRAGEVIPEIIGVKLDERENNCSPATEYPKKCLCGGDVELKVNDSSGITTVFCLNDTCVYRKHSSFLYVASVLQIKGLGESVISKILDRNPLISLSELLTLPKNFFLSLEGFKEKSSAKLSDEISSKIKEINGAKLIQCLQINLIGETASELIYKKLKTLEDFKDLTYESLISIKGLGEESAKAVIEWLSISENLTLFDSLVSIMTFKAKEEIKESALTNKTVVITGSFKELNLSRTEIENKLALLGAKISSSISKRTDYLIAGDNAGSKLDKAKELNISILSEEDLKGIFNG